MAVRIQFALHRSLKRHPQLPLELPKTKASWLLAATLVKHLLSQVTYMHTHLHKLNLV